MNENDKKDYEKDLAEQVEKLLRFYVYLVLAFGIMLFIAVVLP